MKHGFICTAMSPPSPPVNSTNVLLIPKVNFHDVELGM